MLLFLNMTIGELSGWLSTVGIGLIVGGYKLYKLIESRGKKIGEDEARESYQLDTIQKLIDDHNSLKKDIEELYKNKANKEELDKILNRLDKLVSIIINSSGGKA